MSQTLLRLALAAAALPGVSLTQTVVSYHGVSSATHQTQFNTLSGNGYRITSLSVAGSLAAPLYSAVWELQSGPAWAASHDMSSAQYTSFRTTMIGQGYRAKILTAAGSNSAERVFAAVFVDDGATVADASNYSQSTFLDTCATQRANGKILVSADLYGGAGYGPYVCAVFEPNTGNKVWGCDIDANSTEFAETRNAHEDGGERLYTLGMSDDQRYISVWYDDRVGTETMTWNATGTGFQTFYNNATPALYHRTIASGGSGASLRFAGSFAQYRSPLLRYAATTGVYRSQFAAFDDHMRNVLIDSQARAGALAIAKDGKLVYARGFTRAESGYPTTQPDDVFRIASLTKVFNAIATHQADEQSYLTMTERPQAILGLPYTATGFNNVQIRHILEYVSGIPRNYSSAGIAAAMGTSLPTSLVTGVNWLDDQALLYQPPSILGPFPTSYSSYSNAAWMLTAECIRVRTGSTFINYLQNQVFNLLNITRAKVAASSFAQLGANDVFPHLSWLRTEVTELNTTGTRVSEQFHEDLNFKRASGGMACSAIDYVRFLSGVFDLQGADAIVLNDTTREYALDPHTFIDFESGNPSELCRAGMSWQTRPNNVIAYSKGGSLESASTNASWRTDGVSFAIFVNIGDAGLGTSTLHTMLDGFTAWPSVDEFPSYGMPSFQQRPRLITATPTTLDNVTTSTILVTGKRMDTVTQVNFGGQVITSQSPANWGNGYFEILDSETLRVSPPPGLFPSTYALSLVNSVGTSASEDITIQLGTTFRLRGPSQVQGQPFAVYVGRGTSSGLPLQGSFVILCLSFSNAASTAPGVVSLGLGNQFTDLLTTDARSFGLFSSSVRFDLPVLPTGTVYLEAVGLDLTAPNLFPLSTTNTIAVTRP